MNTPSGFTAEVTVYALAPNDPEGTTLYDGRIEQWSEAGIFLIAEIDNKPYRVFLPYTSIAVIEASGPKQESA